MSKSNNFPRLLLPAALTISVVGLAVVLAAPGIGGYLRTQSNRLSLEAKAAEPNDPHTAAVKYQMAAFLQPGNHDILKSLANMYVRLDQPDKAIATLRQLPLKEEGIAISELQLKSGQLDEALRTINELVNEKITDEVLTAKSRILLEMDKVGEAARAADDALRYAPDSPNAKIQLGLCQLVGEDETGYQATLASLNGAEAAKALQTAHGYKLALARELYAQGLLRTSERVLRKLTDTPTERYILQAKIKLAQGNYSEAKDELVRATKLDPANLEAHQMLEEVLIRLGDDAGAAEQVKLIKSLQSGIL